MNSRYADDDLRKFACRVATLHARRVQVAQKYAHRTFKSEKAQEYATHGFLRRLYLMARSIQNVFSMMPPENNVIPDDAAVGDVTINLQSFLLNTSGCLDNLAWVWSLERCLKRSDGGKIHFREIGIGPGFPHVQRSFDPEMREYLESLEGWFRYIAEFRGALAHRIPIYVPPHSIDPRNLETYQAYEMLLSRISQSGNVEMYEEIKRIQMKYAHFQPVMSHSFSEQSRQIIFHAQIMIDYDTILELSGRIFSKLD